MPGQRDLGLARRMVADAIGELVPEAQRLGVRLGIEALHPMFCADRCVISSLGEAVDLALRFPADAVGVVVDTYHVWWDARLADEIARAGRRIVSYQVCDWVLPLPQDTLLGRGHLGDGVIDFGPISASVAAAGLRRLRGGGDLQRRGLGRAAGPDRGDGPGALRRRARRTRPYAGRAPARSERGDGEGPRKPLRCREPPSAVPAPPQGRRAAELAPDTHRPGGNLELNRGMDHLLPPEEDTDLPAFCRALGVPGLADVHTHFLPPRMLRRVWDYFDAAGPLIGTSWPIRYKWTDDERVAHCDRWGCGCSARWPTPTGPRWPPT